MLSSSARPQRGGGRSNRWIADHTRTDASAAHGHRNGYSDVVPLRDGFRTVNLQPRGRAVVSLWSSSSEAPVSSHLLSITLISTLPSTHPSKMYHSRRHASFLSISRCTTLYTTQANESKWTCIPVPDCGLLRVLLRICLLLKLPDTRKLTVGHSNDPVIDPDVP